MGGLVGLLPLQAVTVLLSASWVDATVAWYQNDGSQNFAKYDLTTLGNGAHSVYAADVDGDGDVDVLATFYDYYTVTCFYNDGSQSFTEWIITTLMDGSNYVIAADVDGDGDVDPLSSAFNDGAVAWFENV